MVFAREAKESEHILEALQHVVLAKVDCEKGEGPKIAEKYGVRGYPTYLVVNAEGEVTDGLIGYPGDEAWARFAKGAAADRRTIARKLAAHQEQPTAALARSLANHATTSYDFKGAVGHFQTARDLDADRADEYTEQILTYMYYGASDGVFTFDEVEAEAKPAFHAPEAEIGDRYELASMLTEVARSTGEPARAAPYLSAALELDHDPDDPAQAEMRSDLAIDAALIVDGDPERAVALKRAALPEDWRETDLGLVRFAWWCFQNEVNLDEAFELALKSHELAGDDKGRARGLRVAAEICAVKGDCGQAVDYMKRAVALHPDRDSYKARLEHFEALLAEQKQG